MHPAGRHAAAACEIYRTITGRSTAASEADTYLASIYKSPVGNSGNTENIRRVTCIWGTTGLFVAYEREEKIFLVIGIHLDLDLAFACEPSDSGKYFLVFEFADFLKLFET